MVFEELKAFPRILRVGHKTQISGRLYDVPRDIRLGREAELKLTFVPEAGVLEDGRVLDWAEVCDMDYEFSADGSFRFEFTAPDEGEYTFQFILQLPHGKRPLYRFSCYALEEDLFELKPFKGDTHVHTCWSGCAGIDQEPPYVAATLRSRGLDFTFITDHCKQYSSLQAIRDMAAFESDFQIYPGEECHVMARKCTTPDYLDINFVMSGIHQLSLGASCSVIEYTNEHFDEYTQFLEKRMAELPADVSESQRKLMAGLDWIVKKTHEFGGLSVFAHPFWKPCDRLNLPPEVREYIFENGLFDAVEVIGLGSGDNDPGYYAGIVECMAWLYDKAARYGRRIPVTGATDCHHARSLAGYQYTMAFARENTLESIMDAIRSGRTLACRSYPGEHPFFWGDFRLVRYAEFLQRDFFPEHDEMCVIDGKLMLQTLRGDIPLESVNSISRDCTEKLFRRYWAGSEEN